MPCRVVCISHTTGAGGEQVGRRVAERLGFLYVDDGIVAAAAAKAGVDPEEIADEERRKSFATRVLQAMGQGSGEAWALTATTRGTSDEPSSDDLRAVIRQTIEQIAGRGMTVIVSHAASHVVAPGPDALRVFVTASRATREARLREEEGLDREGAARAVKDSDAGRRDYLKRFYEADDELPTHYDLVVNTDVVSVERAAQLVSDAASS